VTIPDSVTAIDDRAFAGCLVLETVTIPESVVTIGEAAFAVCRNLLSITIPDSVKIIGKEAFKNCVMPVVAISDSVEVFGEDIFAECSDLRRVGYCGDQSDLTDQLTQLTRTNYNNIGKLLTENANIVVVCCEDGNFLRDDSSTCTACPFPDRCADGGCVEGSGGLNCASCVIQPEPYYQAGESCVRCPDYLFVGWALGAALFGFLAVVLWYISRAKAMDGEVDASAQERYEGATGNVETAQEAADIVLRLSSASLFASITIPFFQFHTGHESWGARGLTRTPWTSS
jgi:hypothetical protein